MKTRIKVVEHGGYTKYYPQYKGWILWHHFEESDGWRSWIIKYAKIDDAKNYIDRKLAEERKFLQAKHNGRIISTHYIKYP